MNSLTAQIRDEVQAHGPIPFARFMELALYAPGLGYYERECDIGRRGDFFTSVSVGPLFGELLAFRFAEWMKAERNAATFQITEAGAHDGKLAADILGWFEKWRPELFERLSYCLIEPSPSRRQWQENNLRRWQGRTKWLNSLDGRSPAVDFEIIFSNELLDAMPVRRLAWNVERKGWDEYFVAWENEGFVWRRRAPSNEVLTHMPAIAPELAAVLPDGWVFEISPAAELWWKSAAESLGRGKLLAFDYGLVGNELFRPERHDGTLRCYSRHHVTRDLLGEPGECDITAHVNFSAIEAAGNSAGLLTETMAQQERFLTQIVAAVEAAPGRFDVWTPARLKQFKTLTHPEHLGSRFRVLVQSRPN